MWCTSCGQKLPQSNARFCDRCGAPQSRPEPAPPAVTQVPAPEAKTAQEVNPSSVVPGGLATRPLRIASLSLAKGEKRELPDTGLFLIGRGEPGTAKKPDFDLTELDTDLFASRNHAQLDCRRGDYILKDLQSRNGTFVNGRKLAGNEEYLLKDQDEIAFGKVVVRFIQG